MSNTKKSLKIPKRSSESVNRGRTDNTIFKRKRTKGQTTIYKHVLRCNLRDAIQCSVWCTVCVKKTSHSWFAVSFFILSVSDCCLTRILQLYHGENKLIFNEMMRSALYWTLSWTVIVLAHRNNSSPMDMLPHSGTLS